MPKKYICELCGSEINVSGSYVEIRDKGGSIFLDPAKDRYSYYHNECFLDLMEAAREELGTGVFGDIEPVPLLIRPIRTGLRRALIAAVVAFPLAPILVSTFDLTGRLASVPVFTLWIVVVVILELYYEMWARGGVGNG